MHWRAFVWMGFSDARNFSLSSILSITQNLEKAPQKMKRSSAFVDCLCLCKCCVVWGICVRLYAYIKCLCQNWSFGLKGKYEKVLSILKIPEFESIGRSLFIYFLWSFIPFIDRTVERQQKSTGWREGSGICKGPRDRNRTRVTMSAVVLYVDTLTTRLLAPAIEVYFKQCHNYCGLILKVLNLKGFCEVCVGAVSLFICNTICFHVILKHRIEKRLKSKFSL